MTVGHELGHAVNREWHVIPPLPEWNLEYQMESIAAAILAPRHDLVRCVLRSMAVEAILRLFRAVPQTMLVSRLLRFVPLAMIGCL